MKTHEDLCRYLETQGLLKTPAVAAAVKAVDRAHFVPASLKPHVYLDQPVRAGHVHLSAPFIYAAALEALGLRAGSSFLNIGSGTGYISYLVSMLAGETALNHGVELLPDLVTGAKKAIAAMDAAMNRRTDIQLVVGNGFCIEPSIRYDAIYVGAGCNAEKTRSFLFGLLRVNGVMVVPFGDELLKVCRTSETVYKTSVLASVCFSPVVMPPADVSKEQLLPVRFADKQWSPQNHFSYPKPFQDTVVTLLLVNMQGRRSSLISRLPPLLLFEVASFMHRDWFEEGGAPPGDAAGQRCLYGALQRLLGSSGSGSGSMALTQGKTPSCTVS